MGNYTQWFDEWGLWDPYAPIISEIDEDIDKLLMGFGLIFGGNCHQQNIKFQHRCVDWDYHVGMLEYTNEFVQRFWMSWQMFDDLVEVLRVPLTVSYAHSMSSTSGNEPIYPEVIVAIGLRI